MYKLIIRTFIVPLVAVTVIGCASLDPRPSLEQIRAQNRQNLLQLSPGITKSDVLKIMGTETISAQYDRVITNPYRTEMYRAGGHTFELILYYTDIKKSDDAITDDELMPIVILDGKLDGWGWSYWNNLVQKYELRVR